MGYFNEFPHTRGYDGDLGYLIKIYKELVNSYNTIASDYQDLYTKYNSLLSTINNELPSIVTSEINELVNNGTVENMFNSIFNKNMFNKLTWHFSIDDVQDCFSNLINNSYESLFDEPHFAFYKQLHENYGATVSLYVFTDVFNTFNSSFKTEFMENSDWMKIGFHGPNSSTNLGTASPRDVENWYQTFVTNAINYLGRESIDICPRFSNFITPFAASYGLINTNCGIIGALGPDDTRDNPYTLSVDGVKSVYNNGYYKWDFNDLTFVRSYNRLDNGFNETTMLNYINSVGAIPSIEIFIHEPYYNSANVTTACNYLANTLGLKASFLQYKLPPINFHYPYVLAYNGLQGTEIERNVKTNIKPGISFIGGTSPFVSFKMDSTVRGSYTTAPIDCHGVTSITITNNTGIESLNNVCYGMIGCSFATQSLITSLNSNPITDTITINVSEYDYFFIYFGASNTDLTDSLVRGLSVQLNY